MTSSGTVSRFRQKFQVSKLPLLSGHTDGGGGGGALLNEISVCVRVHLSSYSNSFQLHSVFSISSLLKLLRDFS